MTFLPIEAPTTALVDGESETFVTHALRADGFDASEDGTGRGTPLMFDLAQITSPTHRRVPGAGQESVAFNWQGGGTQTSLGYDPDSGLAGVLSSHQTPAVAGCSVRRLTPTECERLMGFPDSWTNVPHRKKPAADGPRYHALGNSIAVPVLRWVGNRIAIVDALPKPRQVAS